MPEAKGDVFVLHDDGTVALGWDGEGGRVDVTLRRPTVGQWLDFMEASEAADAWIRNEPTTDEKPKGRSKADPAVAPAPRTVGDLMREGPYLDLYARVMLELGSTEVAREAMPPWLADGGVFRDISGWWRTSPLHRRAVTANLTPSR